MRIISWNVNGIRATLKKDALRWAFARDVALVCLQEVKARPEQLSEAQRATLPENFAWHAAERPGYSGVATFLKRAADEVLLGLGAKKFDAEGRVAQTVQYGFRLLNVYVPSGTRGTERVDYKLDFNARLLKVCDAYMRAGQALVLCGDLNTAHQEIDLTYPRQNRKISGFLPEERAWIQRFLDHGFVDVFRHLYPEKVQYTWWTSRVKARERGIGWRLDYFLVSRELMPRVQDVIIHDEVTGSDHCPVELVLRD